MHLESILSLSAIFNPFSFEVFSRETIILEFSISSIEDLFLFTQKTQSYWAELLKIQSSSGRDVVLTVNGLNYPLSASTTGAKVSHSMEP